MCVVAVVGGRLCHLILAMYIYVKTSDKKNVRNEIIELKELQIDFYMSNYAKYLPKTV